MQLLIQYTIIYASVLVLVALGGCFSEHSGVINIGLEGTMIIGALAGAMTMNYFNGAVPGFMIVIITFLVSALAGVIYSLLLAVSAVTFKADQTIIGTAMNMLGIALTTVIARLSNMSVNPDNSSSKIEFIQPRKCLVANIDGFEISIFFPLAVIIIIISYIVLYKTRFGLRLMSCGENPQAADSVGINVAKMRYSGVMLSGALGGIGGIAYITAGVSEWKFEYGVGGFGFLALAVMIFGNWKPVRIGIAALIFGLFRALSNVYMGIDFLTGLKINSAFYNMMPYIFCLLVLVFTSKRSRAPKAEGIPYDKSIR